MEIGHSHKMRKIILWMKAILLLTVMTMTMMMLMTMLMKMLMKMAVVLGAGECEGQPESGETAASITPSAHSAVDTISHNISLCFATAYYTICSLCTTYTITHSSVQPCAPYV